MRVPTADEDGEIDRGIAADPDAWVPTEAEWSLRRPAGEVDPELVALLSSGRRNTGVKQYHVIPRAGRWAVRSIGARTSETFQTKPSAIARARQLAKESGVEWVEYRRDGTVRIIHRPDKAPAGIRHARR